jgi:hypothetical protein
MSDIDLKASELVLELESIGNFGTGHFARVMVERRPELAKALYAALQLSFEDLGVQV